MKIILEKDLIAFVKRSGGVYQALVILHAVKIELEFMVLK